jgi:hypothetical protein
MAEYGNGVGQATGVAGGSGGGQTMDAGAAIGQAVVHAVDTLAAMPPTQLVLLAIVIVVGCVILRRAF